MKFSKLLLHYVLSYFLIFSQVTFVSADEGTPPPNDPNAAAATANDPSSQCSNGFLYNENSKSCVHVNDMNMVNNKHKECMGELEGSPEREECIKQVEGFGENKTAGLEDPKDAGKQSGIKGAQTLTGAVGAGIGYMVMQSVEKAYQAACVANKTTAASKPCYSSYASIIAFVMGIYNENKMNKDAKKQMGDAKKELYKLVEEHRKTKGRSYEMQIKLMQAYQNALNVAENIASQRLDGYKQERTAQLLIMVIAAIDIARGLSSCPACNTPLIACGIINISLAGIGLGFTSILISKAEEAKKTYGDESDKIGKIIKKYQDFFLKQHIDADKLAQDNGTRLNGTTAPVSVDPNGNVQTEGGEEVEEISEFQAAVCAEKPGMECCKTEGKTCQTFSLFGAPSLTLDNLGGSDLEGVLSSSNDIIEGRSGLTGEEKSFAISNNLKRMKKIQETVLGKLKKNKYLTKSDLEKMDPDKAFKAYLKKNFGDENHKFKSDGFGLGSVDLGAISGEGKDENAEDEEGKIAAKDDKKAGPIVAPFDLSKLKMNLDDLDDDEDADGENNGINAAGLGANGTGLAADEEYVYKDEDIVKKPEVSIFNVISNRYNILRIKKEFGQRPPKR
jgi:uncharacterized protein (UPF0212 family)